jgi:hypothetical protein
MPAFVSHSFLLATRTQAPPLLESTVSDCPVELISGNNIHSDSRVLSLNRFRGTVPEEIGGVENREEMLE